MKPHTFILLALLLGPACASNGSASFDANVTDPESECLAEIFPFDPVFVAARERGGAFGLFFQSEGGNIQDKDVLYFEVFDVEGAERDEILEFSKPGTIDAQSSGEVEVVGQCPDHKESYYLVGSVRFDSFERKTRGKIRGEMLPSQIIRYRDEKVVAEDLTGRWDLLLRRGPPFEEFQTDP